MLSQNNPKSRFLKDFFMYKFKLEYFMPYFCKEKSMCLRTYGSFKSANHKKDWVRKNLQKARKSYKKNCGFAILISYLQAAHLCQISIESWLTKHESVVP
jgi:hypothetical protein